MPPVLVPATKSNASAIRMSGLLAICCSFCSSAINTCPGMIPRMPPPSIERIRKKWESLLFALAIPFVLSAEYAYFKTVSRVLFPGIEQPIGESEEFTGSHCARTSGWSKPSPLGGKCLLGQLAALIRSHNFISLCRGVVSSNTGESLHAHHSDRPNPAKLDGVSNT